MSASAASMFVMRNEGRSTGLVFLATIYAATIIVVPPTAFADHTVIVVDPLTGKDGADCLQGNGQACRTLEFAGNHAPNDSQVRIESERVYLDGVVRWIGLNNVSYVGNGQWSTVIDCNCSSQGGCGFEIVGSFDITLSRLSINSCGFKSMLAGTDIGVMSGLFIANSGNLVMENVALTKSRGYGAFVMNLYGHVLVKDCSFDSNSPSKHISNNVSPGGTGLFVLISACPFNSTSCNQSQLQGNYTIDGSYFTSNGIYLTMKVPIRIWPLYYGGGLALLLRWGALNNTFCVRNSQFRNNTSSVGAGMSLMCQGDCSYNRVIASGSTFHSNQDPEYSLGGIGVAMGFSSINRQDIPSNNEFTVQQSNFTHNRGYYGVGVLVYSTSQPQYTKYNNKIEFHGCVWDGNVGRVSPAVEIEPDFLGTLQTSFLVSPVFTNCQFLNNEVFDQSLMNSTTFVEYSGVMLVTKLTVLFQGTTLFQNNTGTALYIDSATVVFQRHSQTKFVSNWGNSGGALSLVGFSSIQYNSNIEVFFINNSAAFVGGAIYVLSTAQHLSLSSHTCFFDYANSYFDPSELRDAKFYFEGNIALSNFGHSIYLTSLQPCINACFQQTNVLSPPEQVFSNESCLGSFLFYPTNRINNIITGPSNFEVNSEKLPLSLIPGRQHSLPLEAYDDFNQTITSATLYVSKLSNPEDSGMVMIDPAFHFVANNSISMLGVPGMNGNLTLLDQSFRGTATKLSFKMAACPPGYVTNTEVESHPHSTSCQCSTSLSSDTWYRGITGCNESSGVAFLRPGHWIGYIITDNFTQENEDNLYTSHCPLGFCKYFFSQNDTKELVTFYPLIPQASQQELSELVCATNREGTLCSQCKEGHSVFFHSNQFKCGSNTLCLAGPFFYILSELLPITAVFFIIMYGGVSLTSGVACNIIFIIQVLNPLNISVNGAIKFTPSVFIDTLSIIDRSFDLDFFNLEQLSFCLWAGASTLDMIAVKYVSILFAFGLIGIFVYVKNRVNCRCFTLTRFLHKYRLGNAGIRGLCAFIILCYSRCTNISFSLLALQPLQGKGGLLYKNKNVAFLDGSLYYFEGRHLYYALPALACTLLVVVPLPLLLFCDPFLIKFESLLIKYHLLHKLQPWTSLRRKLKPVFDTFQGCFRDKHRYFAGLYFAYRFAIYLMYVTIPSVNDFHFALEMFLIVVLVVQAMVMPFEVPKHNFIAILVFACLLVINSLTVNIYSHIQLHGSTPYVVFLQWVQLLVAFSPILFCILVVIRPFLPKATQWFHFHQQSANSVREDSVDREISFLETLYNRIDSSLKKPEEDEK